MRRAACSADLAVDGVIATNTTIERDGVEGARFADEVGGLSGAPLYGQVDRRAADAANAPARIDPAGRRGRHPARRRCRDQGQAAGALLVQVYTDSSIAARAWSANAWMPSAAVAKAGPSRGRPPRMNEAFDAGRERTRSPAATAFSLAARAELLVGRAPTSRGSRNCSPTPTCAHSRPCCCWAMAATSCWPATWHGVVVSRNALLGLPRAAKTMATACVVRAEAGERWDDLVRWSRRPGGLCGLENLSLIPGTVGAAPIQNIGAYGTESRRHSSHDGRSLGSRRTAAGHALRSRAVRLRLPRQPVQACNRNVASWSPRVELRAAAPARAALDYPGVPRGTAGDGRRRHAARRAGGRGGLPPAHAQAAEPDAVAAAMSGSFFKNPMCPIAIAGRHAAGRRSRRCRCSPRAPTPARASCPLRG
jgi:hypothetical protein